MAMKEGTKIITVRLSEEDKFDIEKAAYMENRSVNNFIVTVLKEYLKTQKK